MSTARLRAYFYLLIVSVIWGVAGVVIKYTLFGFPPLIFLLYRFFIASIAGVILFIFFGFKVPKDRRILIFSLVYGFSMTTLTLSLLFFGTDKTTSIDANLISAIAPVVTVVGAAILINERVSKKEKIGIAIAFLGTLITVVEPVLKMNDGVIGLEGNLLILLSVVIGALNAIFAKVILRGKVNIFFLTNIAFIVGFITTLPLVLIYHSPLEIIGIIQNTPLTYQLGVVYMALISGTLAYTLWHHAEKTIEVGEVSIFAYLFPVFGTPLSVLWLHEKLSLPFIIGAAVIIIGVLIAEWKKKRYKRSL